MSNKEFVLSIHPGAHAHSWADCWIIYSENATKDVLGQGKTAALAWKSAALKEGKS